MYALSRYHELGILPKDPEKILTWKTKALAGGFDMNRFNPPAYTKKRTISRRYSPFLVFGTAGGT